MTMKILVLGYGNEFRQDDRVGHELAPRLVAWLQERGHEADLWLGQQVLPEIVYDLAEADLALFVDASVEILDEGWRLESLEADRRLEGLNIHALGPAWVLALMEDLALKRPRAYLLSVSGHSFDFSEELSPGCQIHLEAAWKGFLSWWSLFEDSQH